MKATIRGGHGNATIIFNTNSHRSESGAGAGAGRTLGGSSGQGYSVGGGGHARARVPELGKRSASAPQVRMRCERTCKSECQTATIGDSF
eukprot:1961856-Pleurochrysis_carterae.AAC.1